VFDFGCISARNRENSGNTEVKYMDKDFVADTGLLRVRQTERFLVLDSSWNGDGLS
jgi:hypothetical protein